MLFRPHNRTPTQMSELAKRFGWRISKPHGYYPEDVDATVEDLVTKISTLEENCKQQSTEINTLKSERDAATKELAILRMQISSLDIYEDAIIPQKTPAKKVEIKLGGQTKCQKKQAR